MPHRELLTESQRLSLQAPASDERGMVRHYMLSSEDLALINRRRGDPNRLGFALTLCYLRFPGRILQQGEQPPAALCAFVAEQLTTGNFPKLIERLSLVRVLRIEPERARASALRRAFAT
jgi:TnpA family transposase